LLNSRWKSPRRQSLQQHCQSEPKEQAALHEPTQSNGWIKIWVMEDKVDTTPTGWIESAKSTSVMS
jgi:hypothetical protein